MNFLNIFWFVGAVGSGLAEAVSAVSAVEALGPAVFGFSGSVFPHVFAFAEWAGRRAFAHSRSSR